VEAFTSNCGLPVGGLLIHSAPMGQSFELRLTGLLTVAFECRPAATGSYNPQLIELHYQSA